MLIIEIHVDTVEETKTSASKKTADKTPKRGVPKQGSPKQAPDKSHASGNHYWKAFKHRVPGYLIQYHKNEK